MKPTLLITLLAVAMPGVSLIHAADKGKAAAPAGVPAAYPLKKCPVSDEALGGEMGKPIKVTHDGTDVYLCCKSCIKKFNANPEKFVKMVKDAQKK